MRPSRSGPRPTLGRWRARGPQHGPRPHGQHSAPAKCTNGTPSRSCPPNRTEPPSSQSKHPIGSLGKGRATGAGPKCVPRWAAEEMAAGGGRACRRRPRAVARWRPGLQTYGRLVLAAPKVVWDAWERWGARAQGGAGWARGGWWWVARAAGARAAAAPGQWPGGAQAFKPTAGWSWRLPRSCGMRGSDGGRGHLVVQAGQGVGGGGLR